MSTIHYSYCWRYWKDWKAALCSKTNSKFPLPALGSPSCASEGSKNHTLTAESCQC